MRTGGDYIIFAGYQFMFGSVSTQRLSSDQLGGNTFVNALDFLAGCTVSLAGGSSERTRGDMDLVILAVYLVSR